MNIAVYTCRMDDRRESKRIKIMSHLLWPDADWWLWLDWPFRLTVPAEELIDGFDRSKMVGFAHALHDCGYMEHAACARMQQDSIDVMRRQMDRYRLEKFPAHFGLLECGVLMRRNCPEVVEFNHRWWSEVEKGSTRDQLSFGYAAWKTGMTWATWPGTVWENQFTQRIAA